MPVLESTDRITPRSALRHRPIGTNVAQKGKPPVTPRASRQRPPSVDTQEDIAEWQRADEQGKVVTTPAARQKPQAVPSPPKRVASLKSEHRLAFLGIGMLLMLALWIILTSVINWVSITMDDLHYGRPRTYQTDAFVGHNEAAGIPSHFIAINLRGHIDVIEFPGGDETHARVFLGPQLYGSGTDLIPVTLRFVDLNGDHRLDMIVQLHTNAEFSNSDQQQAVFLNDHGTFRPMLPSERPQIDHMLQKDTP